MSWNWMTINHETYFVCTAITLLIQLITLVKLIRSGKYMEGIKITVIFMISNIALTINFFVGKKVEQGSLPLICVFSIATFVFSAFQNFGHWMFSYEYYNMARTIPYVLDDITPPESIVTSNRI